MNIVEEVNKEVEKALEKINNTIKYLSEIGYLEKSYLLEWLDIKGNQYIEEIRNSDCYTEDYLEFLKYKSFILSEDLESDYNSNTEIGIAEYLTSVKRYISEYKTPVIILERLEVKYSNDLQEKLDKYIDEELTEKESNELEKRIEPMDTLMEEPVSKEVVDLFQQEVKTAKESKYGQEEHRYYVIRKDELEKVSKYLAETLKGKVDKILEYYNEQEETLAFTTYRGYKSDIRRCL